MKTTTHLYKYNIPLSRPLPLFGKEIKKRKGYFVEVKTGIHSGIGEISPLCGVNQETMIDIKKAIEKKISQATWESCSRKFPSVGFGYSQAKANLKIKEAKNKIYQNYLTHKTKRIKLSAFLPSLDKQSVSKCQSFIREGFRVIKIKFGRGVLRKDIAILKEITQNLPRGARLRLDFNKQLSYKDAVDSVRAIDRNFIEYIEDPVSEEYLLKMFHKETGVPIALDRQLTEVGLRDISQDNYIQYLIVKPMAWGNWDKIILYMMKAIECGIRPVLSSSYETGIGLWGIINLAFLFGEELPALGIGTYDHFEELIYPISQYIQRGSFYLADKPEDVMIAGSPYVKQIY